MLARNIDPKYSQRLRAARDSHANVVLVTFRLHIPLPFHTVESAYMRVKVTMIKLMEHRTAFR